MSPSAEHEEGPSTRGMAQVVERNIQALLEDRQREERAKPWQDAVSDRITRFTGSLHFVYLHLGVFGLWILINLGWTPIPPFDPSFVVLAMVAAVQAQRGRLCARRVHAVVVIVVGPSMLKE